MNIVGIAGPAGCGKDTAAQVLIDRFRFHKMRFADPLKRGVAAMFDWDLDALHGADRDWRERPVEFNGHKLPAPRFILQTIGTDWGRDIIHKDLWVMLAENDVVRSKHNRVVFTDLRFENEAAWIRSKGGIVIHLSRKGLAPIENSGHVSEGGLKLVKGDWELHNAHGIGHLHDCIRAIVYADMKLAPND